MLIDCLYAVVSCCSPHNRVIIPFSVYFRRKTETGRYYISPYFGSMRNGLKHSRNDQPDIITDRREINSFIYPYVSFNQYLPDKMQNLRNIKKILVWYKDGKLHRDNDQPAVIINDNVMLWYKNNRLHRKDDQPAFILADDYREWRVNGRLHRENDQPAVIGRKTREWWKEGWKHRDNNLPAIIEVMDGELRVCWYTEGVNIFSRGNTDPDLFDFSKMKLFLCENQE